MISLCYHLSGEISIQESEVHEKLGKSCEAGGCPEKRRLSIDSRGGMTYNIKKCNIGGHKLMFSCRCTALHR